jgi:hypothetical protein
VLVLGEGRIAYESRVEADRPRQATDLIALRGELLRQLGVEEGNR